MTWEPTPHLLDAMRRRAVTWADVVHVLDAPEVSYAGRDGKVHQRGHLAVVTRGRAVVTVLLRRVEQWTDSDARRRTA